MISYDYYPFTSADIDAKKNFTVDGRNFRFRLRYNEEKQFFTMDIFDEADVFLFSNRLTYGYFFYDVVLFNFPIQFMPLTIPAGLQGPTKGTLTKDNLGVTVFLVSRLVET